MGVGNDGMDEENVDFGDPDITPDTPTSSSAGVSTTSADDNSTWSTTIKHISIPPPFTAPIGLTLDISSPPEVFDLFFSPDLTEKIVREQCVCKDSNGRRKIRKMVEDNSEWVEGVLGIQHSDRHKPPFDDYWPRLRYAPVADDITRDRFREIFRYLHLVDIDTLVPRGEDGHDCFGKVRSLISTVMLLLMRQWSNFKVDHRWNSTCHWNLQSVGSRCGLPQTAPMATSRGLRSTQGRKRTPLSMG